MVTRSDYGRFVSARRLAIAVWVGFVGACSADSETPNEPVVRVPASVSIAPETVTLDRVGASQQLTATVIDQLGDPIQASIAWSSSNTSVASVAQTGMVTAVATGTTFVTANASGVTASRRVDVSLPVSLPISVAILSASQVAVDIAVNRVTVSLRNNGGSGFYRLEFWAIPNVANGPNRLLATTEPIDVTAGYQETLSWHVPVGSVQGKVYWILALSRPSGSGQYVQTSRFNFP